MTPPPKLGRSWYRQTNIKNRTRDQTKRKQRKSHHRPTESKTNSYLYLQNYTKMLHAKDRHSRLLHHVVPCQTSSRMLHHAEVMMDLKDKAQENLTMTSGKKNSIPGNKPMELDTRQLTRSQWTSMDKDEDHGP